MPGLRSSVQCVSVIAARDRIGPRLIFVGEVLPVANTEKDRCLLAKDGPKKSSRGSRRRSGVERATVFPIRNPHCGMCFPTRQIIARLNPVTLAGFSKQPKLSRVLQAQSYDRGRLI